MRWLEADYILFLESLIYFDRAWATQSEFIFMKRSPSVTPIPLIKFPPIKMSVAPTFVSFFFDIHHCLLEDLFSATGTQKEPSQSVSPVSKRSIPRNVCHGPREIFKNSNEVSLFHDQSKPVDRVGSFVFPLIARHPNNDENVLIAQDFGRQCESSNNKELLPRFSWFPGISRPCGTFSDPNPVISWPTSSWRISSGNWCGNSRSFSWVTQFSWYWRGESTDLVSFNVSSVLVDAKFCKIYASPCQSWSCPKSTISNINRSPISIPSQTG